MILFDLVTFSAVFMFVMISLTNCANISSLNLSTYAGFELLTDVMLLIWCWYHNTCDIRAYCAILFNFEFLFEYFQEY